MRAALRPARPADLDALAAIEGHWPTTPHWSRGQFEAELRCAHARLLVAEQGGAVTGYAGFWIVESEAQITTIAVHPDHARRGLGRLLLKGILDAARRARCTRVTLEVSARNAPALSLYSSAGFEVVGRRPKYYNDGSDALLMDKCLDNI